MKLNNPLFLGVVVLAIFACSTFGEFYPEGPSKCFTPDGKPGTCLLLEKCSSLNKLANDFQTQMTLGNLLFLINSQCNIEEGIPMVCCSWEELITDADGKGTWKLMEQYYATHDNDV